ncbi:uncharacterized protein MELLADRAFT_65486 [Melampsora larici-populina 98AG31]|uniref:Secreted protein n=1 Tax=Melampsora larici-populina (strain 98AG31 / pathotype 3-4-7) TaxID=747676 RepID=F4RVJ4_MELLP|nr:uncharacterized protein MELLADRAFT_65486 [Melampsora larici-populina 98AG31]EGG03656.1 hypothetical protein MELLADRAFT_65486 [Melampsora larici-populina 98AG31]
MFIGLQRRTCHSLLILICCFLRASQITSAIIPLNQSTSGSLVHRLVKTADQLAEELYEEGQKLGKIDSFRNHMNIITKDSHRRAFKNWLTGGLDEYGIYSEREFIDHLLTWYLSTKGSNKIQKYVERYPFSGDSQSESAADQVEKLRFL